MEQRRSIEHIVDEQVAKWNRLRAAPQRENALTRKVITISREPGAEGTAIAQKLAEATGMDFMNSQIIQKVAQSTHLSEMIIQSLDEKDISFREDWLKILFDEHHLWPDSYLSHLMKVISTIGRHGNAVIVGRGANHVLPPSETFRVRLIAPQEHRIANVMRDRRLSHSKAEEYVIRTESDRKAFIRKYFHTDIDAPLHYDLVINTSRLDVNGTAHIILSAFNVWRKNAIRQYEP